VWEAATICPRPLQVDLLILKVVSKSRVTWATSVPILVFLGLSVLDLCLMYTTDRRQTHIIAYCLHPTGAGHSNTYYISILFLPIWQQVNNQKATLQPSENIDNHYHVAVVVVIFAIKHFMINGY